MDTLLVIRDSVAVVTDKAALACQPCINGGTTWQDVVLRGLEYAFFLCLAYWIISGFFKCLNQWLAMKTKNVQEQINCDRKQKSDLLDKLLSYYKDRLIINRKDDNGNPIEYDKDICDAYTKRLEDMLSNKNK